MSVDDNARRSAMESAVQEGVEMLRGLELAPSTRSIANLVLRFEKERDPEKALDSFGRLARDLRHLLEVVDSVYERGLGAEHDEGQRHPYQQAWLSYHERKLEQLDLPADRIRQWLDDWMEALAHSEWEAALKIIDWDRAVGDSPDDLRKEMRSIVHDMRSGRAPTIGAIDRLMVVDVLSLATRVHVHVLKARTLLRYLGNPREAAELMKGTARFARGNDSAITALVRAVRAETGLAMSDLDAAKRYVADAYLMEDEIPDRMVAAGQIALAEQDWTTAADLFDATVRQYGRGVERSRLLSPVPANLVLAVARSLRQEDPSAADKFYDRAIEAGLQGRATQRLALREHGELLANLGRPVEAAAAIAQAAELCPDFGSEQALEAWQRAHELDPDNAEYCWSLGEQLRFSATDVNGIADEEQVLRALELLERGALIAGPTDLPGWVMVSLGLAAHSLRSHPDPALWLERAILRDGPNANNCAFLARLHRLDGFAQAAVRVAKFGVDTARPDSFLADQWIVALIDLGRFDEALRVLDDSDMDRTDEALWRGWIECRRGRPEAGLAVLDEADDGRFAFLAFRWSCYDALGDDDGARKAAEQILEQSVSHQDDILGWAEYTLGRLDDAIDRLERQYERTPQYHNNAMSLGVVLLVRGDPERRDVDRARTVLLNAIVHSNFADELAQMLDIYFDQTARRLADRPHNHDARDVLATARKAAAKRIAELLSREPNPELLSQQLAEARELRAGGELEAAVRCYAKLSPRHGVPEAVTVLQEAVSALIADGDEQLAKGEFDMALATWNGIAAALGPVDSPASRPEDLAARLGLSELVSGGPDGTDSVTYLGAAGVDSLVSAVPAFARDLDLAWPLYDGLLTLAQRIPEQQAKFASAAARLLRPTRSDLKSHSFSPSARACEILLDEAHADQEHSPDLAKRIALLREQVKEEWGISIPGVRVAACDDHSAVSVTFRVFEQAVSRLELEPAPDPVPAIMKRFSDIVADNLFRWISLDDLELWNGGWNFDSQPIADLPEDLNDRVRLTRVLRSLLSEGISIRDRVSIVDGFRAGLGRESTGDSISIMTAVRRRLYPAITASGGEHIWSVPLELEGSIRSALDKSGATMARDRARELREALRAWRADALPAGPVTISLRDTALRSFVWHLVSPDRPRMFVVAEQEIATTELGHDR